MANKSQEAVAPSLLAVPIGTKKNPLKESKKDELQARKPNACEQHDKKNVTRNKVKKENNENISKNLQRDTKVTATRNTRKQLELTFENESQEKNILNKDTSKQKSTSRQKTVRGKSSSKVEDSTYKMIDSEIKDEITSEKQEPIISDVPSVSVFASTSRGKETITKENSEKTNAELQINKVSYFYTALNNEICRFTSMCDTWNAYKETNANLPENVKDLIDAAVEQANLLMNKKFQQFRKLINACQNGCGKEKPVTCEDLHRFWDMVYIQVDNVNKRFNRLTELRIQNWQENHPFVQQKNAKKGANARKKFQSDALNEDTVLSEDVIASSSPMNN